MSNEESERITTSQDVISRLHDKIDEQHRTLEQDVFSAIHDYAATKPEQDPDDPESWESWFEAAFDLLGTRVGQIFEEHAERSAPAHPAEGVPAQIETLRSELAEEKEAADNWRRLAMQFDNHRLQALWHLKRILHADSSADEYKAAEQFLAAPPLDGEAVLAQRIAALAATQPAAQGMDAQDAALWREHVSKLDALITYCPTCCQGFASSKDMSRDEVIFECGKTAGRSATLAAQAKQGG